MRTISLTGTALSTSRLGFGTSGLHHVLGSRSRQRLLGAAYEAGIRHFDTAPFYGHGSAERELGRFLKARRGQLQVATKFGLMPNALLMRAPWLMVAQAGANALQRKLTGRNVMAAVPRRDYSAREARRSLEHSLRRLSIDHVDILFLHAPKAALVGEGDELVTALCRVREEGKARYIGLAGDAQECMALARRYPDLAQVLQIDASQGTQIIEGLPQDALPWHFSFGHFRAKRGPFTSLVREALDTNPNGVILFSSVRAARVAETARLIDEFERR